VFEGIAVIKFSGAFPSAAGLLRSDAIKTKVKPAILRRLSRHRAPLAYTNRVKLSLMDRAGISASHLFGDPQLSATKPCVSGVGDLYFFGAIEYFSKDNRVVMLMSLASPGGFVSIRVAPASSGTRYLLDIRLSGVSQPLVRTYDGTAVRADANGHALFVVTGKPDQTATLTFTIDGDGLYNFHDVTISRIS
jgi:hypothetical protein